VAGGNHDFSLGPNFFVVGELHFKKYNPEQHHFVTVANSTGIANSNSAKRRAIHWGRTNVNSRFRRRIATVLNSFIDSHRERIKMTARMKCQRVGPSQRQRLRRCRHWGGVAKETTHLPVVSVPPPNHRDPPVRSANPVSRPKDAQRHSIFCECSSGGSFVPVP